jgi:RES domain-containing protein
VATSIDRVPVRGTWFRQAAAGLDPLALRRPPGDGRWQRGDVVAATYLADSEQTVWAEWYRALAEVALPPRAWLPCDLWRVEVDVTEIADLSDGRRLRELGLEPPRPGRGDWPPYQALGERLFDQGCRGLIAPSAARLEGRALCLFRPSADLPGVRPAGRQRRVEEPPAPPRGLRT